MATPIARVRRVRRAVRTEELSLPKPRRSHSLMDTSPFRHPTAPSADKAGDKAGEKFGPYLVYEQLGEGGMAYVHRAEMLGAAGFRKTVALKRMRTATSEDPDFVTSFIHEGQLAGRLRHPNIAQAYELGKIGGVYYISMEFVPGPTLAQILAQSRRAAGAVPLPIVLEILIQLCDALDHAHDLRDDGGRPVGLVHRDISPMNIIVSRAGIAKLIDFGIAKQRYSSVVTQAGVIKGKHAYVAPEYVAGTGFDRRVDLWGLGVVAHEMITGRRLFLGDTDAETIRNVRQMPIQPPSRIAANVSPELDDIVMTALERDPDLRWQNAAAMRAALTAEARRQRAVVSGAQLRDWIEWAFRQPTREDAPIGHVLRDLEPSISLEMHELESVDISGEISAPDEDVPTVDAKKPAKRPPHAHDNAEPKRIVIARDVLPRAAIPRLETRGTPNPRAATPILFARNRTAIPSLAARAASPAIPEPVAPEISTPIARRSAELSARDLPSFGARPPSVPRPITPAPRAPTPPPVAPGAGSPRAAAVAELSRASTADARAATPLPPDLEVSRPIVLPRSPSDLDEMLGVAPEHEASPRPRSKTPPHPVAPTISAERATPRLRIPVPAAARRSGSPPYVEVEVTPAAHQAALRAATPPLHLPEDHAVPQVVVHVVTPPVAPPASSQRRPRWNPPTRWQRDKPRSRHLPQFLVLLMIAAFAVMCVELNWIDLDRWQELLADYI